MFVALGFHSLCSYAQGDRLRKTGFSRCALAFVCARNCYTWVCCVPTERQAQAGAFYARKRARGLAAPCDPLPPSAFTIRRSAGKADQRIRKEGDFSGLPWLCVWQRLWGLARNARPEPAPQGPLRLNPCRPEPWPRLPASPRRRSQTQSHFLKPDIEGPADNGRPEDRHRANLFSQSCVFCLCLCRKFAIVLEGPQGAAFRR